MTQKERTTKETAITLSVELMGSGKASVSTGIGFFDHMLEALAKHGLLDLDIRCQGDTHVDYHHSVEDVGIVLGQALNEEIFPANGRERFADATVVLDEAAVSVVLDLSGRPFLVYEVPGEGLIGEFDMELAEEFFRALVINAGVTAHIIYQRGRNRHHIVEAAFKAFAIALRRAVAFNERITGVPSTKGVL